MTYQMIPLTWSVLLYSYFAARPSGFFKRVNKPSVSMAEQCISCNSQNRSPNAAPLRTRIRHRLLSDMMQRLGPSQLAENYAEFSSTTVLRQPDVCCSWQMRSECRWVGPALECAGGVMLPYTVTRLSSTCCTHGTNVSLHQGHCRFGGGRRWTKAPNSCIQFTPFTAVNTTPVAASARRGVVRVTLLVVFCQRTVISAQNGPKAPVDAYGAQSRCVIDVKLCGCDGGDSSSAVLGSGERDM